MSIFRKSSYCQALNQDGCVEVAHGTGAVLLRDSTDPDSPVLAFPRTAWAAFAGSL
ncbi:hypothetical protein GCM10027589_06760 [Actinocorallia lasiicapitis]